MESIVARRAARGGEFMDEVRPGWFDEIRLEDLNIAFAKNCILGQIYGSFRNGLQQTDISPIQAVHYGFIGGPLEILLFLCFPAKRLTRAWRHEIEKRRVQAVFAHTCTEEQVVVTASV